MRNIANRNSYVSGFTITELMLTIAVTAVILTVGVPSFQGLMERNQLTSNINQIVSSLAFARSEAIKRNLPVALCASSNGENCSGGGFETGWIVYVNRNSDGNRDNDEEILWVSEALPANLTLRGNGCCTTNIPYTSTGRMANIAGSLSLCKDNDTQRSRKISINISGRVRLVSGDSDFCTT